MDRSCCYVLKVTISFRNSNFSPFEHVTTHHQTLQTWIGLNVTRYHNLNALPHTLPHALPYIVTEISLVLGYSQHVTTRYHHFFLKNINIYIFLYI